MTATTAVLLPIQRKRVRNAMMNAFGRHGVSQATAQSIWLDLTTGNDPRPANLPESFHYRGIKVDWPIGRHTRLIRADELNALNTALISAGVREQLLDREDTAEAARTTYSFLHHHKSGAQSVQLGAYNPEPVKAAKLRELVAEATAVRESENEPVLVHEGESMPYSCDSASPKGKPCTLTSGHDAQHANGSTRWGTRDRVADRSKIADPCKMCGTVFTTPTTDDMPTHLCIPTSACGVPGPFDGVFCTLPKHEGDEHVGTGYAWTGENEPITPSEPSEPVSVQACPFDQDECLAMQDAGEGECDEHEPPTREELIAAAQDRTAQERTNVQILTTPERAVSAQVVELEPTTEIDTLLAELRELSTRLETK